MPYLTNNRHRIFYRENGSGPLLLILPGNTASSAHHEGELAYFGRRFHAVSLDFWGTGQSDRLEIWHDTWWEEAAADTAALIRHLGEGSAFVMGTSGGGIVALHMAIRHPEQVHAVVADSCVERFPAGVLEKNVADRDLTNPASMDFWRHAHGEDWWQVVKADSDFLLRFSRSGGDCFKGHFKEIRCPVLFTASLKDEMLPDVGAQALAMVGQIPGSQAFFNHDGNHPLMWSRQRVFRSAADAFLEQNC